MSQPVESITSAANPRIKALATLRRKGSSAGDSRILIDGHREITRAAQAGLTMQDSVYRKRVEPRRLPEDAPNILVILIDDVGAFHASVRLYTFV